MMETTELRVVVFKGMSKWVAQCLEYDIATQADTYEELPSRLIRVLRAEVEFSKSRNEPPFETLPKAPARYWAMWKGALLGHTQEDAPWRQLGHPTFNVHPAIVSSQITIET